MWFVSYGKIGIAFDDDFESLMVKPLEKLTEKVEEKEALSIKYISSTQF